MAFYPHVPLSFYLASRSTNEQRFYTGHDDDILCLTHYPEQDLVATGQIGKNPPIHVWHMKTLETKAVLTGFHARGVCAIDFHPDGKRLASVGLDNDHTIYMWDWRAGTPLASTRGHKDKIFEIRFNPMADAEVCIFLISRQQEGYKHKQDMRNGASMCTIKLCSNLPLPYPLP